MNDTVTLTDDRVDAILAAGRNDDGTFTVIDAHGEARHLPAAPTPDTYGRVSAYALHHYRVCRGMYDSHEAKRCRPAIHNLTHETALRLAVRMMTDPKNSWVSVGIDAF